MLMTKRRIFDLIVYALFIALIVFCYFRISSHWHYQEQPERKWTATPSVRYQDELYFTSIDQIGTFNPEEWIVVGSIQSLCPSYEIPTENFQTNCGVSGEIRIHLQKTEYLIIMREDGRTILFKKKGDSTK